MLFDRSYFLSRIEVVEVLRAAGQDVAGYRPGGDCALSLRNKTRLAALRVKDFGKRDVMVVQTCCGPTRFVILTSRSWTRKSRSSRPS